jgi:hypothetical protein
MNGGMVTVNNCTNKRALHPTCPVHFGAGPRPVPAGSDALPSRSPY